MIDLRYTLVADGTSDSCLMHVIDWVLRRSWLADCFAFDGRFADPRHRPANQQTLDARIRWAVASFPCELLFVHRDAERDTLDTRLTEVTTAADSGSHEIVPIVPVRMTEAWLLIDNLALRTAAGNPNGSISLDLPPVRDLESLPDPKAILQDRLLRAAELPKHRNRKRATEFGRRRRRLAELITDYSPLRQLSAFQAFEKAAAEALERLKEVHA